MADSDKAFPPWPLIRGSKASSDMNLFQEYVGMHTLDSERGDMDNGDVGSEESVYGRVLSLHEFIEWAGQ